MVRLAGFKYWQIVKKLKKLGFEFDRQAAVLTKSGLTLRYPQKSALSGFHAPAWEQVRTLQRHETWAVGAATTAFPRATRISWAADNRLISP